MTKVIDYVISIDTFEQQCVVLKGMFQSLRLKDNVHIIGIDQYLSNNVLYEKKSLEIIKNLYKQSGKWNEHKQFKYILDTDMISTTEVFTDEIPIYPMTSTPVKKKSAIKSLCLFTNIL